MHFSIFNLYVTDILSDAEAFVRELAQCVPQHGDALMTIAEQLELKGIEKNIQLGEQRVVLKKDVQKGSAGLP